MKVSRFALGSVLLALLSVSGWASDKMKANIRIFDTVHLGATELAPGEYKITWTESGSNAEVSFWQGKKVIATVPAQITQERSEYNGTAVVTDSASNALTGVKLPTESFSFSDSRLPAKSGN